MPGRVTGWIVDKKALVMALIALLTIICAFCMIKVEINEDMTKYLPDDSSMKKGVDLMAEEFPEIEMPSTIRVMFDDLTETQKKTVRAELEALPHVDSVTHEADSSDYNKENHTLYVLSTPHPYGSEEELAIEECLDTEFTKYDMVWHNDDLSPMEIPVNVILLALAILLVILFAMCGSWVEPLLFLLVIGAAIIINMGTNLIMGSVSNITFSVAAILQLVLSMDYSIILMNRYRQEKALMAGRAATLADSGAGAAVNSVQATGAVKQGDAAAVKQNNAAAMKNALRNAFSSIASSSLTTVAGLIMLVFMSFKIGMDLGVVLAKGVFISMVCAFTLLPGLILVFDRLIERTAKKSLHVPMGWAAGLSYKLRHVMGIALIALFVLAYILQSHTGITYTLARDDKVAEIFPPDNTLVLVYENKDEDAAAALAGRLEADENTKSVAGYATMLGKPYTAQEMADEMAALAEGQELTADMMKLFYYDHYTGGETGTMTAGRFLHFISEDVVNDETFAAYIDADMKNNAVQMRKFADAGALTAKLSAKQLAAFFGMSEGNVRDLLLYYFMQRGGAPVSSMTMAEFTDFVVDEVAADPNYGSMFDQNIKAQLEQLQIFTDTGSMTVKREHQAAAQLLGMDASMMQMVYTMHNSQDVSGKTMTLQEFTGVLSSLLQNPAFGASFDEASKRQIQGMDRMIRWIASDPTVTPAEIAAQTGMDEASAAQLVGAVRAGAPLDPASLSAMFGMETSQATLVFRLYYGANIAGKTMSVEEIVDFILADEAMRSFLEPAALSQLQMMQQIIKSAISGTTYAPEQLAALTGMETSQAQQLYLLYTARHGDTSGWRISVVEFIDFIVSNVLYNRQFSGQFNAETAGMLTLAQTLVHAVVSGREYNPAEMTALMAGMADGLEEGMMELMYLYAQSLWNYDHAWTMTLEELFHYMVQDVLKDPRFASLIEDDMRKQLLDSESQLTDGKAQMVADRYSRLIITTSYPEESAETMAFLDDITAYCNAHFDGRYHLVGNSAMVHEMKQSFDKELLKITLLTALAIFLIVAVTFRSLVIPALLVLLVQSGVYITVFVTGVMGGSIYYLALLIVECILMGATIDYGILMTNYYRESRRRLPVREALGAAYEGSTHTILTSGLILIIVTAIVGNYFGEPTVEAIIKTVSVGVLCATILILFVLPGVLAVCDRLVVRRKA